LSALTGGKAFATDSTAQAIAQATSDAARVNYRLVFSPDRLDGKYHKLRVTTTRKDLKIQTAQNYYAVAEPDVEGREAAFVESIGHSPFDYPEIGVAATMAMTAKTPAQFRFAIHVDGPDVLFLRDSSGYHGRLATALVEYAPDGRLEQIPVGEPINLDMSEEDYAKAMTGGIELTRQAAIDDTVRQVRVIVLDRNSDLAGTVTMPIARNP
jgi:hypothetical protein